MRIKYLLVLFTVLGFAACEDDANKFSIIGSVNNMPEQDIYLEEIGINDFIVIDSARSNQKGEFELSGTTPEPSLYRLRFKDNRYVLLSIDKGNLKVAGNWSSIEKAEVTGSEASTGLRTFLVVVREHLRDFNTMEIVMDSLRAKGNDSMLAAAVTDMRSMNQRFIEYIEQYADTTKHLPNALFAAKMLNPQVEKEFMEVFVQNLEGRFPDSKLATEFTDKYKQMMAMNQMPASSGPVIGKPAPEISLETPDGEIVSLSSFKGQYVLIDFWASWCGPCRKENPNVVNAFNKFKSKNFTILGVSLDTEKDNWQEAIHKDKLTWTHISDLRGWESMAARNYDVNAIPTNFLVDPEGNIVARDLRGDDLHATLDQLLVQ